jgi:hypothetical protein
MKIIRIVILIAFTFIFAGSLCAEDLEVTAQGEAAGSGLSGKEKATEDALRKAIEKGFGVYIDSTTLTENAALVSDDVIAETRGFIRSYDVLEEKEQEGVYLTRVRAVVSLDKIWESDSLNLLLKRMGAPRFILFSSEDINGESPKGYPARQKMTEVLVGRGFKLVDSPKTGTLRGAEKDEILTDPGKAIALAKDAGAEIIVLLKAKAVFEKQAELYGKHMTYFNGICETKVIQTDSGTIIAAAVGKAVRGAGSPAEAIHDSFAFSSLYASEELIKGILSAWAKYLNMGRPIEVVVTNVSVSRLANLIEALKSLEGVSSVSERKYSNRTAHLEIKSKHKTIYLAESIENIPGFKIEVNDFSLSRIRLTLSGPR